MQRDCATGHKYEKLLIVSNLHRSCDRNHAHLGEICHPKANTLHTANQCTKFEDPSFSHSRDILWGIKI